MIDPLTVARANKLIPLKVNAPPGGPDVIPSTPTSPRFVTPPLLVSIVGFPMSDKP